MSYTISFDDESEMFVMGEEKRYLIGDHLKFIANKEGYPEAIAAAISETHLLCILQSVGVEIELVNCDW